MRQPPALSSSVSRPLRVFGIVLGTTLAVLVFGIDCHLIDQIWFRVCMVVVGALTIILAGEVADRE